jgi:hypothetical protein
LKLGGLASSVALAIHLLDFDGRLLMSTELTSAVNHLIGLISEPLILAALGIALISMGFSIQARRSRRENLNRIENIELARKELLTKPVFFPVPPNSNSLFGFKVPNHSGQAWRPPMQPVDPGKNKRNGPYSVELVASSSSCDDKLSGDTPEH